MMNINEGMHYIVSLFQERENYSNEGCSRLSSVTVGTICMVLSWFFLCLNLYFNKSQKL